MKTYHLYTITHTSGRTYVGQSVEPLKRKGAHFNALKNGNHQNCRLQRAWNRDGESAFKWSMLSEHETQESCDAAEVTAIAEWQDKGLCYNFRGGGHEGSTHSPETREKMRKIMTGRTITQEWRDKIAATLRGSKASEETKRKLSEAGKGRKRSAETNAKIVKACTGRKRTEESKARMSAAAMGRVPWNKGVPMRAETKEKLSHTMFKPGIVPWNTGGGTYTKERCEQIRRSKLGKKASAETRQRMAESQRLRRAKEKAEVA
jgi:group I intron endonuclease